MEACPAAGLGVPRMSEDTATIIMVVFVRMVHGAHVANYLTKTREVMQEMRALAVARK
jgi:hypothetical protein